MPTANVPPGPVCCFGWAAEHACLLADADFMAFKQHTEGDPELLPSAEVQLELKEQAKKALTGTACRQPHACCRASSSSYV